MSCAGVAVLTVAMQPAAAAAGGPFVMNTYKSALTRTPSESSWVPTAGVALLTVATQPRRLWRAQLPRLLLLAAFLFAATAIGADGVPPVTQPRVAAAAQVNKSNRHLSAEPSCGVKAKKANYIGGDGVPPITQPRVAAAAQVNTSNRDLSAGPSCGVKINTVNYIGADGVPSVTQPRVAAAAQVVRDTLTDTSCTV